MGRDGLPPAPPQSAPYFNPRAPYGARPETAAHGRLKRGISIHAPRMGRDRDGGQTDLRCGFQSTRPVWGATRLLIASGKLRRRISIHAPHAGRDPPRRLWSLRRIPYFNPRAPCGARLWTACTPARRSVFQSTRPMRGATMQRVQRGHDRVISIHAPHAGRDLGRVSMGFIPPEFQSMRPVWGATHSRSSTAALCAISIHAPRMGRDPSISAIAIC